MIVFNVPDYESMCRVLLSLDSKLVTPELQQKWLSMAREDEGKKRIQRTMIGALGKRAQSSKGGQA